MWGLSRNERNTKAFQGLGLAYDDRMYGRLAKRHKAKPISLKKAALNARIKNPTTRHSALFASGHHTQPLFLPCRCKNASCSTHILPEDKRELEAQYEEFKDNTSDFNKRLLAEVQPQLDLLEMIASERDRIVKGHERHLSLSVETHIHEIPLADTGTDYYYHPSQKLWLHGNNAKVRVL